jgi:hypothetical protein
MITMKGNYIHHTSGRGPKMVGNTLLHAVNNEWYAVSRHTFDIGAESMVAAEGNVFQNVVTLLLENAGQVFCSPSTSANAACEAYLGHVCRLNAIGSSGSFEGSLMRRRFRVLVLLRVLWRIQRGLGNFEAEQYFALKVIHYGCRSNSKQQFEISFKNQRN